MFSFVTNLLSCDFFIMTANSKLSPKVPYFSELSIILISFILILYLSTVKITFPLNSQCLSLLNGYPSPATLCIPCVYLVCSLCVACVFTNTQATHKLLLLYTRYILKYPLGRHPLVTQTEPIRGIENTAKEIK